MKKIYKYPTGAEIPEGAIYLGTVSQTEIQRNVCKNVAAELFVNDTTQAFWENAGWCGITF